jgi:hypothetical protein
MWNETNSIMTRAASQSAERQAHFLPGVLVLAILLLAASICAIVLPGGAAASVARTRFRPPHPR